MISIILAVLAGLFLGSFLTYLFMHRLFKKEQWTILERQKEWEQKALVLQTEKQGLLDKMTERQGFVEEMKEKMLLELQHSHLKALQESSQQLSKSSKENLENLLSPFQNRLKELQERIHSTYDFESRERLSLKKEIEMMVKAHEKMTQETSSLSQALRGEAKVQGDWGEITLRRIFEASGLKEGLGYQEQGKGFGLRDEEGVLRKPDFLVLLPGERHIVVDSKVSLVAYENFAKAQQDLEKNQAQAEFVASVHRHMEDLSRKDYPSLHGIKSPDFTLMFLPTDGAFTLALQSDEQLHFKSWQRKVILTCPSLLLPILKTVEFMWKQERQSKNAEKIADAAGRLYDKFASFLEDLEKVRTHIQGSERSLEEAFNKIKYGKGNLIRQTERLKELGAKAKKQISQDWQEDEVSPAEIEGGIQ